MKKTANHDNFFHITRRDFNLTHAPAEIALPIELVEGMQSAWDNSFPKGQSQEQGGILVRSDDSSYKWKVGKLGTSGSFIPNYGDVAKNETLVAIGHTHPYDKEEGGYTDVSFSGSDLAFIVYQKQFANIVQSGQTLFLTAPTAQFNKLVEKLDGKKKKDFYRKIEQTWFQLFLTHQGKLPERAEAATKATCEKYKLVYYRGKGHSLVKVDTSKQNDKDTK